MLSYLDDPEASRKVVDGTAGCTPATKGWRSWTGRFFITGRLKEVIIRGGEKHSPLALERIITAAVPELAGRIPFSAFRTPFTARRSGRTSSPTRPSDDLRARLAAALDAIGIDQRPKVVLFGSRPIPRTAHGQGPAPQAPAAVRGACRRVAGRRSLSRSKSCPVMYDARSYDRRTGWFASVPVLAWSGVASLIRGWARRHANGSPSHHDTRVGCRTSTTRRRIHRGRKGRLTRTGCLATPERSTKIVEQRPRGSSGSASRGGEVVDACAEPTGRGSPNTTNDARAAAMASRSPRQAACRTGVDALAELLGDARAARAMLRQRGGPRRRALRRRRRLPATAATARGLAIDRATAACPARTPRARAPHGRDQPRSRILDDELDTVLGDDLAPRPAAHDRAGPARRPRRRRPALRGHADSSRDSCVLADSSAAAFRRRARRAVPSGSPATAAARGSRAARALLLALRQLILRAVHRAPRAVEGALPAPLARAPGGGRAAWLGASRSTRVTRSSRPRACDATVMLETLTSIPATRVDGRQRGRRAARSPRPATRTARPAPSGAPRSASRRRRSDRAGGPDRSCASGSDPRGGDRGSAGSTARSAAAPAGRACRRAGP